MRLQSDPIEAEDSIDSRRKERKSAL